MPNFTDYENAGNITGNEIILMSKDGLIKSSLIAQVTGGGLLNGKLITCFGDSITSNGNYPSLIAQNTGATVINCGISGSAMARTGDTDTYHALSMASMADGIATGDWTKQIAAAEVVGRTASLNTIMSVNYANVHVLTISMATNDYGNNRAMGDNNSTTPETFKGAINYVINKILTAYPAINILFLTPIWRARHSIDDGKDCDVYPNIANIFLREYSDAIIELADINHVRSINLFGQVGINKYTASTYLAEEGLHPIEAGYLKIASFVSGELLKYKYYF